MARMAFRRTLYRSMSRYPISRMLTQFRRQFLSSAPVAERQVFAMNLPLYSSLGNGSLSQTSPSRPTDNLIRIQIIGRQAVMAELGRTVPTLDSLICNLRMLPLTFQLWFGTLYFAGWTSGVEATADSRRSRGGAPRRLAGACAASHRTLSMWHPQRGEGAGRRGRRLALAGLLRCRGHREG
jgi:hypothetical protein